MVNKSVKNRIKINKSGKMKRRSQGLGHNRSKWGSDRRKRKTSEKSLDYKKKMVDQLLN
jgi:ribosomal protein L35